MDEDFCVFFIDNGKFMIKWNVLDVDCCLLEKFIFFFLKIFLYVFEVFYVFLNFGVRLDSVGYYFGVCCMVSVFVEGVVDGDF